MKKKITGIVLALSIVIGGTHSAGAVESAMGNTGKIGANVEETTITTEGDVTTISGPDGITTLTEDAAANTITINSPNGVTVLNRNEVLGFEEQGGYGPLAAAPARGIVTDWRVCCQSQKSLAQIPRVILSQCQVMWTSRGPSAA